MWSISEKKKWNIKLSKLLNVTQMSHEQCSSRNNYHKHIPPNRVHIIQIPSAAPSFMGIWAIRNPLKIHCYTCMSSVTCWSRLIYTKLSLHRSFVINMYVITMAWRRISPWSFQWSLQRTREMDIFNRCQHISAFWSKNNPKKRGKLRLNACKHWEQ